MIMTTRLYILILSLAMFFVARSTVVDCRPGELHALAGADASKLTELTLTGEADASDLFFIADRMPQLRTLDMSALSIVAYSGETLKGSANYPVSALPDGLFAGSVLQNVKLPGGLDIGAMAFASSRLKSLELPPSTRRVGIGAFASSSLVEATLSGSAEYESDVFSWCLALERVNLSGMKALPPSFFKNCQKLSVVDGAAELTEIGEEAFHNCVALKDFQFGARLSHIGDKAFLCSGLTRADMSGCAADSIGRLAFLGCQNLNAVDLPPSCGKISDYGFACSAVRGTLNLGSVAELGSYSFASCNSIASIIMPGQLSVIGDGAFTNLRTLSNIFAGKLGIVPALGAEVFGDIDRTKVNLYVAENMTDEFAHAEIWQDFNILIETEGSINEVTAPAAVLRCRRDGQTLVIVSGGSAIERADVFSASGQMLISGTPAANKCTLSLDGIQKQVIIVGARLADGSIHSLKISL